MTEIEMSEKAVKLQAVIAQVESTTLRIVSIAIQENALASKHQKDFYEASTLFS